MLTPRGLELGSVSTRDVERPEPFGIFRPVSETPPGALPLPIVPGLTGLEIFARGGYATVYRATQLSVGREVAVKVENRTLDSERDQARFLREARAAGRMSSHPHVVDLFDVGVTHDQHPYLIMELCDGSYAERMRNCPLGPVETRDLGVKIADALAHAHAAGVLHRDVKPANILHSHFNPAVLADFGLAVLAEMRDASVTMEVLTPAYAPPEMFHHHSPSPPVDVYALCATLYALMYGKPPRWRSDRNPSLVTVLELFNQPIPELPGVPSELVDVLRLGMSNDPGARPSAVELRDLLVRLPLGPAAGNPTTSTSDMGPIVSRGDSAYPAGQPSHPTQPTPRLPAEQTHPTQPSPPRRWRWLLGGASMLALAASAAVGAWLASSGVGPDRDLDVMVSNAASPKVTSSVLLGSEPPKGCPVSLPAGGRCAEVQCFGPLRVWGRRAEAERVPCEGRHTWESYAEGELPLEAVATDWKKIKADPTVQQVCSASTFQLTSGGRSIATWKREVLPPLASGERTYRCLAGKGVDALTAPTLSN